MLKKTFFLLLVLIGVPNAYAQYACGHANSTSGTFSAPSLNNNAKSDTVDIIHYHLDLDLYSIANNLLKGKATLRFTPKLNGVSSLSLDLLKLQVDSITHNGSSISFSYNDTIIQVQLPATLNIGDTADVTIFYKGSPQGDATGWGGFHRQNGYYFNLGVGFGADPHTYGRAWFPCFDNFVEKSTYSFKVLAKAPNRAFCNGLQTSYTLSGDSAISIFQMNEPIPTYLTSVAVSTYELVQSNYQSTNKQIPVWLIAKAADTANMKSSFRNLNATLASFEKHYGPYEWSKVGYATTTVGAMEHATSIHYPISAVNGNLASEDLMAHELAHHWWGNLITCQTDADMWINEGMAEFSSHLYTEQVYGYSRYIDVVQDNAALVLKSAHTRDGAYLPLYGLNHGDVYGFHVYQKGAMVGHNLRTYIGYNQFDTVISALMQNNKYSNLNTQQIQQQLETLSGKNLNDFFNNWIYNPGYPQFGVDLLTNNSVTLSQGLYEAPSLFNQVPVDVTYFDANGDTTSETYLYTSNNQTFVHSVPFTPVFALTGYAGKLLSATTTDELSIKQNRFYSLPKTSLRVTTSNLTDSVHVIAQQHWASPRGLFPFAGRVSKDRYWTLQGFDWNKADLSIRFSYSKNDILLDDELVSLTEDSIHVFYRPNATATWTFVANQVKNTGASTTDGVGYVEIYTADKGEYVLANASPTISLSEKKNKTGFTVFPNPASNEVKIILSNSSYLNKSLKIRTLSGSLVREVNITDLNQIIPTNELPSGTYLFSFDKDVQKVILK